MLKEYIQDVIIHEATGGRIGKDRKQEVDVYFHFIRIIEMNGAIEGKQEI